jgi:hypothetical protein
VNENYMLHGVEKILGYGTSEGKEPRAISKVVIYSSLGAWN